MSSLSEQLCTLGVIRESHLAASSGGRPPRVLKVDPDCCSVIGVDLGSSHIAVLSMNLFGDIEQVLELEMDCCNHPQETLLKIAEMIDGLRSNKPLLGVGVAVPSPVVDGHLSEQILPAWKGVHIQSVLEAIVGVRVSVGNDANLGALAERWWGACKGVDDFVFIKMATGVGAGLVQNGTVLLGDIGYAGELGHVPISNEGLCRCGMKGCLESHIGLPWLVKQAPTIDQPFVSWLSGSSDEAVALVNQTAQSLGIALSILINLLNPQRIVLWGPVPQQVPQFLDVLRKAISSRNLWSPIQPSSIQVSGLGQQGVAQGAATLLLEEAFSNPLLFAEMQG
jgi:predicted NBD/HSP70 family sugar kinase